MEINIEKIFQIYENCKNLLIAPNTDTMKLLFHSMNARILLSQNNNQNENENEQNDDNDDDNDEYTVLYNEEILNTFCQTDIKNYEIKLDKELIHYIMNCYILISEWKEDDFISAFQIYKQFYLQNKKTSHWNKNNENCSIYMFNTIYISII